jgi:hypothetical protein
MDTTHVTLSLSSAKQTATRCKEPATKQTLESLIHAVELLAQLAAEEQRRLSEVRLKQGLHF